MVEGLAVGLLDNEGDETLISDLCQLLAELLTQYGLFCLQLQAGVLGAYLVGYSLVDRLEHRVAGLCRALHHPLNGRLQRVGGNGLHRLHALQLGLEQLAVGFLL